MQERWYRHQHIIFDCDSTLSRIEGIDELGRIAGVSEQVRAMTDAAMTGDIALEEVYGRRLELIRPEQSDIRELKRAYKQSAVRDAKRVVELLARSGHDIYIVSGGLQEPVLEFGVSLGIDASCIRAVGVDYNQLSGQWWLSGSAGNRWSPEYLSFHKSPLTLSEGKKTIIDELLRGKSGRSLLIGDGMSDLLASGNVDQFIGYGGVISRASVRRQSSVFISGESLLPVLALAGGESMATGPASLDPQLRAQIHRQLLHHTEFRNDRKKQYLLDLFKV